MLQNRSPTSDFEPDSDSNSDSASGSHSPRPVSCSESDEEEDHGWTQGSVTYYHLPLLCVNRQIYCESVSRLLEVTELVRANTETADGLFAQTPTPGFLELCQTRVDFVLRCDGDVLINFLESLPHEVIDRVRSLIIAGGDMYELSKWFKTAFPQPETPSLFSFLERRLPQLKVVEV